MADAETYRAHLETLDGHLARALDLTRAKGLALDGVFFHAGREGTYHADDRLIPFQATPHFRRWVPPLGAPEHAVLARQGEKPLVMRVTPRDFWYETSPRPSSYWEESVELVEVESFAQAVKAVGPTGALAYVGPCPEAAAALGIPPERVEPEALLAPLDWFRATKTEHEVSLLRRAEEKAAAGHLAARKAFEAGAGEREVHRAYLAGADLVELDSPYETIVALDEKAATLHYQNKRGAEAARGNVLLLDAGAACEGYAADLTRTWTRSVDPVFRDLVQAMDGIERDLVAMVTPGRPYLEIHLEAHVRVAALLAESGIAKSSAEEALARGVTHAFLPHGVGHHLGLQVHDVGGHQAGPDGGRVPPPAEHPFLRNTRILEPGHFVTIEPGLYFIPMLLEPLRASAEGTLVDWPLVDRLTPCGGVRIEDNVLCTDGAPEDLSRPLLPGP